MHERLANVDYTTGEWENLGGGGVHPSATVLNIRTHRYPGPLQVYSDPEKVIRNEGGGVPASRT